MKKKQKAEPESRRKSSYKGNSRNNSKSGGLTFSEKKRLIQLKHILSGKSIEKEKPTTAQRTITFEKMFRDGICQVRGPGGKTGLPPQTSAAFAVGKGGAAE